MVDVIERIQNGLKRETLNYERENAVCGHLKRKNERINVRQEDAKRNDETAYGITVPTGRPPRI